MQCWADAHGRYEGGSRTNVTAVMAKPAAARDEVLLDTGLEHSGHVHCVPGSGQGLLAYRSDFGHVVLFWAEAAAEPGGEQYRARQPRQSSPI
jgi:hypothetical protein